MYYLNYLYLLGVLMERPLWATLVETAGATSAGAVAAPDRF